MEFPGKTRDLDRATVTAQFDFSTLPRKEGEGNSPKNITNRSYERRIEIYDPPGGALAGAHEESESILTKLADCDVAIAFISSEILLEEIDGINVDDDTMAAIFLRTCLARIFNLLEKLSKKLDSTDIFPVCFVLSKYDLIPEEKDVLVKNIFFEQLLMMFSSLYPQFVVCGCTISLRNPETDKFRSANLGWPFLFAAGGTILRNSYKHRNQAASERAVANVHQNNANRLKPLAEGGFFDFIEYLFTEGIYEEEDRIATSKFTLARESDKLAFDDAKLALDIWSMISAERRKNIRVFKNGQAFDPCLGVK
jgi:hypothetical protein